MPRGRRVKARTLSDGTEVLETIYFDADALRANEHLAAQLELLLSSRLWGNAQTIEDVFNPRIVDDGVCSVTAFTHKHHGVLEPYYFWLARFGGNANGHVIRGDAGPSEEYLPGERCTTPPSQGLPLTYSRERVVVRSLLGGPWVAVAQNVDDDLTWTCPTNPAPEGFMERLRAVVERE